MEKITINDVEYGPAEAAAKLVRLREAGLEDSWEWDVFVFLRDYWDEDKVLVQYTSGTTGEPKEVVLDREAMEYSARRTLAYFELKEGDRALLCLPVKYIAGKMMVLRALIGGLNLIAVEPSGDPLPALITHKLMDEAIEFAAMVPLQVHRALKKGHEFRVLEKLIVGGGSLNYSDREKIKAWNKPEVYETFGMSETLSHVALKRINGEESEESFKALDGVSVSSDARGCLLIQDKGLGEGEFVTNDLVEVVDEDHFRWLGRYDSMINSGGVKLIPEVIEEKVRTVLDVEVLVVGEADEELGEKVVLYLESAVDREQVFEKLGGVLEKFEMPKELRLVKELARTETGKVVRSKKR